PVVEIALDYGRRVEGSNSKLSTWKDGAKILWMFAMLMKETQPFRFFGLISLAICGVSLALMTPVLIEFAETGLVPRMPTWMLSIGLLIMAMLLGATGLILDSVARGRTEQKRMVYLAFGPARTDPLRLGTLATDAIMRGDPAPIRRAG
ncbi:MAG: glycosyl transferase, partial [Mesorhizobium sp.]|nr:glycosyl transferase [Mesorhizobium sp.]